MFSFSSVSILKLSSNEKSSSSIFSFNLINSSFVTTFFENSLIDIRKEKYDITSVQTIIVGNPPYNDVTSLYKKNEKGENQSDLSVKSRDLGISFLKMYSIIGADYVCVLHPLAYLIKKANFDSLGIFKDNYTLVKGLLFSSKLFENINKTNTEFPVVLAFYKRNDLNEKMNYSFIFNFNFEVLNEKKEMTLSDYKTIDGIVPKYPNNDKRKTDLQFYTIRDMNALKRNKTFVINCNNGITVSPSNLYLYAWLDFLKHNFKPSNYFLYGNLSPLYHPLIEKDNNKKALIGYIYSNNKVVKNYFDNNADFSKKVLSYYDLESYEYDYKLLFNILDELV